MVGCQSRWSSARLSQQLTAGWKASVNCSWNDDTSATNTSQSKPAASMNGSPMLPAATATSPDSTSMAATRVVTVVFPLVPVTATSSGAAPGGRRANRSHPSSSSECTGMPASAASR